MSSTLRFICTVNIVNPHTSTDMKRPPFHYPTALPLIPVFTPENAEFFMGDGMLVRDSVLLGNVQFESSPLRMEKVIDLLGISMQSTLLARGQQDPADVLLPKIYLRELYVRFSETQPPVRFADMHLIDSSFEHHPETSFTMRALQMSLSHTTQWCGYDLVWTISLAGELNLEFGNINVWSTSWLTQANPIGQAPALTDEERRDIGMRLKPEVLGYTLSAYRGNRNVKPR